MLPKRSTLRRRAVWELARYDLVSAIFGFRGVHRGMKKPSAPIASNRALEEECALAVDWAISFYWKRVRCLQRSVAATRLLRAYRLPAELVIGCQVAPFVGHAWVEVDGRVLSGPAAYPERLQILERA